ncbi:hypothetical protein FGO68_gene17572 [Halteria grandinella]|uniref:Uncharacterized protein n=1 Tax=Halteria grandinella TaxID=5974 RepID=A0A8J8NIE1_HALGN|nr:hypothetical protein FGO68_gene17572 [Halteria grandinella]
MLYDSLDTYEPHQASHSPTSHSSSSPTKSASYQRPLTKRQLAHLHREQLRYQSDRALAFLGVPNAATNGIRRRITAVDGFHCKPLCRGRCGKSSPHNDDNKQ